MILPNHYRYREYKDEELEEFLKAFPDHADRSLVFREQDRRKKIEDDKNTVERHKQTMRLGGWTLFWAIVAALGTVGLLLLDIPFSKLRHAITSQASPASSKQTPARAESSTTPPATAPPSTMTPASPTSLPSSTPP